MISDSSPKVRMSVAGALAAVNDATALDPLLNQLVQESDPNVRSAIAKALGPIMDPRAADALLALLRDPSPQAVVSAANALKQLGPKLRDDPALARRTANELRIAFESRQPTPANEEVRQALIGAMAPLRQEDLLDMFKSLLAVQKGESPEIRRAALGAIGDIGNPQVGGIIVSALDDKDKTVRLAAVKALGNSRTAADYADILVGRLEPNVEDDPSVRDQVWSVLQSVFPSLSNEKLNHFVRSFDKDPDRRLQVLRTLADNYVREKNEGDLAARRQDIAEAYKELNRPGEAVPYLKQALAYYHSLPSPPPIVLTRLRQDLIAALLLSQQYSEAIAFAGQSIAEAADTQGDMGRAIAQEANRLNNSGDLENAMKLIRAAYDCKPPLAQQYQLQLKEVENDVQKKMAQRGGNPGAAAGSASFSGPQQSVPIRAAATGEPGQPIQPVAR
jgi:HEAT repeat protein